jgi:hypothetical protein
MGKSAQAEQCFKKALKLWKMSQPSNSLSYSIRIAIEKFKQYLHKSKTETLQAKGVKK